MSTDELCLPGDLLDAEGPRQQYALPCARTLVERAVAPLGNLKMSHIYTPPSLQQLSERRARLIRKRM